MDNIVSSPDSHQLQRQDVSDRIDIISKLPDNILLYILSFLSTKDAVRTSELARRWKNLWTYLSDFNLENEYPYLRKKQSQNQTRILVDRILHKANHIKRFRFASYGIWIDADQTDSWISTALKHKVEELDLSLDIKASFVLANSLLAPESLTKLNLKLGCVLHIPNCICFPGLKNLTLSCVTFTDETCTQKLFSGCPVLQNLTLYNCGWKNIKNVSIKIPSIKTLIIYHDPLSQDGLLNCRVTIDAANLVFFSCISYLTVEWVMVNLASLVDAHVEVTNFCIFVRKLVAHCAVKLLGGICHVKSLILSDGTLDSLSYAENLLSLLPTFNNLTHLTVASRTSKFTSKALLDILHKSPNLEVLDIPQGLNPDLFLNGEDWIFSSVPCCIMSSLKSFIFSYFHGSVADMQLLKFLSKNTTILGEITIGCEESLLEDLKKQAEIRNQLLMIRRGLANCVINFQ